MNRFIQYAKTLARRHAPRPIQQLLRRLYYPWLLRHFTEDDWPPATIVKHLVKPGDYVVDVGANVGYVTLLLSRMVGPAGRVYSLEPVPETFDILSANVRKLGLTNVELFNVAASDRDGAGTMEVPEYDRGGANLYESKVIAGPGSADRQTREVCMRALDVLIGDGPTNFIKIDVEGYEGPVVAGARNLIRKHQPTLLIEVSGAESAQDVLGVLAEDGYTPYAQAHAEEERGGEGRAGGDIFFLRSEHIARENIMRLLRPV